MQKYFLSALICGSCVAITIPIAWMAFCHLYPPSHVRLLHTINAIDHGELLYFNGQHPDPDFQFTDKQHVIAGGLHLMNETGHGIRWNATQTRYEFVDPYSRYIWERNDQLDAVLDAWYGN